MKSWLVFKQSSERQPHKMVGSVHATDAEMALLKARSVHARRPKTHSLWVAPLDGVLEWTHEEVEANQPFSAEATDGDVGVWQVFRKTGQRRAMTFVDHVGQVEAVSAETAMITAINQFSDNKETWVWMVVPENSISKSKPDDIESWFLPALDKKYKQQSAYGFVGTKRQGRSTSKKREEQS